MWLVKIADGTSVDTRPVEGNAFHYRRHPEGGISVIALSAFDTKLDSNNGIIDQRHMLVFIDTRRHLFLQLEVIDSIFERVCRILQVLLIGLFDISFNQRPLVLNNLRAILSPLFSPSKIASFTGSLLSYTEKRNVLLASLRSFQPAT